MDGAVPGCPQLYFGVVDVRDVADLHIRAMTDPAAKGERFLAVAGDFMSIRRDCRGAEDPPGTRPRDACRPGRCPIGWCAWSRCSIRWCSKSYRSSARRKNGTGEKARRLLGWAPRSREEAIAATGESLVRLGLLKDSAKRAT